MPISLSTRARSAVTALRRPVPALPLDIYRVGVGILALGYLLRAIFNASAYTGIDGVIDHALSEQIFWFTWQPLFRPWMSTLWIQTILGVGALATVGLIAGIWPRRCALLAYLIVVCLYRHIFLLINVEDGFTHLWLFWAMVMPIGSTLTFRRKGDPTSSPKSWLHAQVPGLIPRLFVANVALVYFIAGITKWTSPLWRSGDALLVILKTGLAWNPDLWSLELLPGWVFVVLQLATLATLVLEPSFALTAVLRPAHRLKLGLGVFMLIFQVANCFLLDVIGANIGCLVASALLFREELMVVLKRWFAGETATVAAQPTSSPHVRSGLPKGPRRERRMEAFVVAVCLLLLGASTLTAMQSQWRQAPKVDAQGQRLTSANQESGGPVQTALFGGLWVVGLAQQYRLLDWIDERNFHVGLELTESVDGGAVHRVSEDRLLPSGSRRTLITSYLLEATWVLVDPDHVPALRRTLRRRLAMRYCRRALEELDSAATVDVTAKLHVWRIPGAVAAEVPERHKSTVLVFHVRCLGGIVQANLPQHPDEQD